MQTRLCAPDDPALAPLIARHRAHAAEDYPAESQHNMDGTTLAAQGVRLFVSWLDGAAIAMGGWKPFGATSAELKSMHVLPEARGQGAGRAIVDAILGDARAAGRQEIFLETGSLSPHAAARRLYERSGFAYCPPFGDYTDDPNSVFMHRAL
ncbi:GNAT family N-acetyltransferase [Gymnodinialimonas sp.]